MVDLGVWLAPVHVVCGDHHRQLRAKAERGEHPLGVATRGRGRDRARIGDSRQQQAERPIVCRQNSGSGTTPFLGEQGGPRSAMMGLLKSAERDDYETAARYLQPTAGQSKNLAEVARQFHALQGNFKGNVGLLSNDPNGTAEPGLPPGQIRAGVLDVGGTTVDVIMVRVDDPSSGKIWLISKKTVANIPKLYAQMESEAPTVVDRIIPAALTDRPAPAFSPRLRYLLQVNLYVLTEP